MIAGIKKRIRAAAEFSRAIILLLGLLAVGFLLAGCDLFANSNRGGISPPTFSHTTGTFRILQNVRIDSDNNLLVRYTTNGSDPGPNNGTLYKNPIRIDSTTTVKAVAYTENGASEITSVTLTLDPPYLTHSYSGDTSASSYSLQGGTILIEDGKLKMIGDGTAPACSALYDDKTFGDFTVSVDIQAGSGASYQRGLLLRHGTAGAYKVFVEPELGSVGMAKIDFTHSPPLSMDLFREISQHVHRGQYDLNNIAVVSQDDEFKIHINGKLVKTISDAIYAEGNIGLVMDDFTHNNSASFDNLRVWITPNVREKVQAPVFAPDPGSYSSAQSVVISTQTLGASIRYTTNGTTPTQSAGVLYDGNPVAISASSTLKAVAYKHDMIDSDVTSGLYTIAGGPAIVGVVVFEDDFQRTDLGTGWTITNCCAGIESASYMYHDGRYAGGAIAAENTSYVNRIDAVELDFRIDEYLNSENRDARIFLRQSDNTVLVDLRYGQAAGYMRYFDGTALRDFSEPITGLDEDVWYHLTVLVDYTAAEFSVYLDDVSYGIGSFRNSGTETGSVFLHSPIYEHPGRINYDNVVLYSNSVPE